MGTRLLRDAMFDLCVRGQRIVRSQLDGDLPGQAAGKTAGLVQPGELIKLGIGCRRKLVSLAGEVSYLLIPLGTYVGVLDGGSGECSRDEPGEPREYEHLCAHAR